MTPYAAGRRLYLDDQPLEACEGELEELGWRDTQEGIRRAAEDLDEGSDPDWDR